MSSQCDTGRLKKKVRAAMTAMIAATSMRAVNSCGNAGQRISLLPVDSKPGRGVVPTSLLNVERRVATTREWSAF